MNTKNQLLDPINNSYQYDAAGNVIFDGSHHYLYDAENRLIQVDPHSGYCSSQGNTSTAAACYVYDALGRRVAKIPASGVWTQYAYDLSGNVISEYGEGCGPTCWARGYVYFNGQRIAEYANSTTYFAHNDHLGSPRLFTDVTAAYTTDCYDFLPFGERNLPTSPCSSPSPPAPPPVNTSHLFTGKERDSESGLDNFEARYFGSSLGRFMSADPENLSGLINQDDPQAWNGYAYVRNNPLVYTDPSGANYTVCDTNGKNCADLTDKQFNQYLKDNPDVSKTASGDLYVGNTKVGSASYYNERDVAAAQFLSGPVQNVVTKAAYVVGGAMAGVYLWTAYTTYGVGTTALNLAGAGGAAAPILYKTGDIIEEVVPDSSGTG